MSNVLTFILCMALIIGGFLLMGYAFEVPGWEGLIFFAGGTLEVIAVAIPAMLWNLEQRKAQ